MYLDYVHEPNGTLYAYSLFVLFITYKCTVNTNTCLTVLQDIARVSYYFVRGNNPQKFASVLVNFMSKVNCHLTPILC